MKKTIISYLVVSACVLFSSSLFAQTSSSASTAGASVSTPIPRAKSPIKIGYFNWSTALMDHVHSNGAQLTTYNYVSLGYKLANNLKVSLNPTFYYNSSGKNALSGKEEDSEWSMGDTYVQTDQYDVALLPAEIGFKKLKFRAYIPTSESSKNQKLVTGVRSYQEFSKSLMPGLNLDLYTQQRVYFYTERGTTTDFGKTYANKQYEIWNQIGLSQPVTSRFGFMQSIGMKSQWYMDVPGKGVDSAQHDYAMADVGFYAAAGPVFFRAQLLNEILLRHSTTYYVKDRPVALFRPDETMYSLMSYVSF